MEYVNTVVGILVATITLIALIWALMSTVALRRDSIEIAIRAECQEVLHRIYSEVANSVSASRPESNSERHGLWDLLGITLMEETFGWSREWANQYELTRIAIEDHRKNPGGDNYLVQFGNLLSMHHAELDHMVKGYLEKWPVRALGRSSHATPYRPISNELGKVLQYYSSASFLSSAASPPSHSRPLPPSAR